MKLTKKQEKAVAEWNSFMVHIVDPEPEAFEGEDMYSVALGFLVAQGLSSDEVHNILNRFKVAL